MLTTETCRLFLGSVSFVQRHNHFLPSRKEMSHHRCLPAPSPATPKPTAPPPHPGKVGGNNQDTAWDVTSATVRSAAGRRGGWSHNPPPPQPPPGAKRSNAPRKESGKVRQPSETQPGCSFWKFSAPTATDAGQELSESGQPFLLGCSPCPGSTQVTRQ